MLVITDERFLDHDTGHRHPERPDRLRAALAGVAAVDTELLAGGRSPRRAERDELELVHSAAMIDRVAGIAERGGGHLDADTPMGPASFDAARLAAGAVLSAVEQLAAATTSKDCTGGESEAYCIVRPPGHHATPETSMGLLPVQLRRSGGRLARRGRAAGGHRGRRRHHGNGTQDVFFDRGDVLYASIHQYPLYPGTGALSERGMGAGEGLTINVPLPPGATGDAARAALDEVIVPAVERFRPRLDVGVRRLRRAPGRPPHGPVLFGFGLRRLRPPAGAAGATNSGRARGPATTSTPTRASSYAVTGALLGLDLRPEPASGAGPGMEVVKAAARLAALDGNQ